MGKISKKTIIGYIILQILLIGVEVASSFVTINLSEVVVAIAGANTGLLIYALVKN